MKGIMDLLARVKLVELSEDEKQVAGEVATTVDSVAEQPVVVEPLPSSPASAPMEGAAMEEISFAAIFDEAGIPPAPFPAEKLLRLLDGLRAMDSATRKAAVLAMDAADDGWQISDSVSDAQHKIAALASHKQRLAAQLQGSEQQAATRMTEVRRDLDAATAAIRQQIAELEQLLERKITQSAQETTGVEAELRATREAVAREARRMDTEIERLREIPSHFTPAAPAAN